MIKIVTDDVQKWTNTVETKEGEEPPEQPVQPEVNPIEGMLGLEHFRRFPETWAQC